MRTLETYIDLKLMSGRIYFTKEEALAELPMSSQAFTAAATRLIKKSRLIRPWRGFFLILRPEDRATGAPEPARWIDPLMKHLKLDYRVSLLRAAAFHGASHQAAMVFQVIVPDQLRSFELGRHRIQFLLQKPEAFSATNLDQWLARMKTDTGFAKMAGVELALLDSVRYFHEVGGINGAAQIVHDIGAKASPNKLRNAAAHYENSAIRRLGYLLDQFGHTRQSKVLVRSAQIAKSTKPLDPSVKPLIPELSQDWPIDADWMLTINTPVEIDA